MKLKEKGHDNFDRLALLQFLKEELSEGSFQLHPLEGEIKFSCLPRCAQCCLMNVTYLSSEEISNYGQSDGYACVAGDVRLLKAKGNNRCSFLLNDKCSSYGVRPAICRSYPFFRFDDVILYDLSCPGIGEGRKVNPSILVNELPNLSDLFGLLATDIISLLESDKENDRGR